MRDRLAHRYFDTSHAVLAATVSEDLPDLEAACCASCRGSLTTATRDTPPPVGPYGSRQSGTGTDDRIRPGQRIAGHARPLRYGTDVGRSYT